MSVAKVETDIPMEEETNEENVQEECKAPSEDVEAAVEIKREGFTSENFKIELNNLPKFFSVGQAKKLFKNLGLQAHKFKPVGHNARYMFVNFSNEDDRRKAVDKLNGFKVKGNKLRAFDTNAAKDPMVKLKESSEQEVEDTRPARERIASAVCALGSLPYEKQLEQKMEEVTGLVNKIRREYLKQLPVLKKEEVAVVEPFIPSPVVNGYRNKCEFTVGHHPETKEVTIGFRLASYKKGSVAVVEPDDLPIVSDLMKKTVKYFQDFVRASGYAPFTHLDNKGHWRQLTLRTNRVGDVMAWIILHPQDMTPEERLDLSNKVKEHFSPEKSADSLDKPLASLYIQFMGQKQKGEDDPPIELLSGSPAIVETLMDGKLKFEISPQSFFQVNVEGAEKLYAMCSDMATREQDGPGKEVDTSPLLFDVCCGTGTIGLCLADKCRKVVGVDIVPEAVDNAKKNALANNVTNAEYHAGRAEHVLPELLKKSLSSEDADKAAAVAVVDPPRAGLHHKAVQALRASPDIRRLVYVSCDAKAAFNSLVALGKPPSNAFPGNPFVPRRVVPVDLFPHTRHFELVLLFERLELIEKSSE